MADIPAPTPPAPISGYRSRAINAAVAYTTATRPLAGDGVTITDGVGGKTISVEPRGFAQRAAPWRVRAYPEPTSGTAIEWKVRVYGGLAFVNGAELLPPVDNGLDEATGLKWYEAPALSQNAPWLCVENDGYGCWFLAWHDSAVNNDDGAEYRAIAHVEDEGPPPRLVQFDVGVVDLGVGGGCNEWLPFDLAVIGGDPCVYVPADAPCVEVRGGVENSVARDASATPAAADRGWVHLTPGEGASSVGTVWAFVYWDADGTTPGYIWGISTVDPMSHQYASKRYIASVAVGQFAYDAVNGTYSLEAQWYHGALVVADDDCDGLATERDYYSYALSLRDFQAGNYTADAWDDVDYVVREERDGDNPDQPYRVNYISGATLRAAIEALVAEKVAEVIHEIIVHAGGSSGDDAAALVDTLDARYQPICEESDPSWGVATGAWTQTYPAGLSQELAGVDGALQSLDARVTALENA